MYIRLALHYNNNRVNHGHQIMSQRPGSHHCSEIRCTVSQNTTVEPRLFGLVGGGGGG